MSDVVGGGDAPGAPGRILLVVAHPDDADFGAAGSVASWTASGWEVSYCIVTDGSAGSVDPDVDLSTLVATREREQRDAASVVGVTEVTFLGYRDGQLEPTLDVRRDISRVIRQVRPDRVVTQSPERNYERIFASHPDHMAAGEATLRAVYPDARNPFAHPELLAAGFEPFAVPEVWMMASPHADRCVDTTDFFDKKLAAIFAHKSQVVAGPDLEQRMMQWQRATAERHGLPEGRLAEAFQVIQTG